MLLDDDSIRSRPRQYVSAVQYMLPVFVRNLGVHIDSDVSLRTHVTATVRSCFVLRQIRSVRRYLPQHALLTLIRALVVSKVDYCCSVLAGVSGHLLDRLQSTLNAAARLVFSARRSERITPLLRDLHWLRVPERIQFRLCVLAFRCLNGSAPPYRREHSSDSRCRRSSPPPLIYHHDACCPVSAAINSW